MAAAMIRLRGVYPWRREAYLELSGYFLVRGFGEQIANHALTPVSRWQLFEPSAIPADLQTGTHRQR
jgi:hypothetical protein